MKFFKFICYELNCVPPKFIRWSLNSQDFRMWLDLKIRSLESLSNEKEVTRVGPNPIQPVSLLRFLNTNTQKGKVTRGDRGRRQQSTGKESSLDQILPHSPNTLILRLLAARTEARNFYYLTYTDRDTLLEQPQQTNTCKSGENCMIKYPIIFIAQIFHSCMLSLSISKTDESLK